MSRRIRKQLNNNKTFKILIPVSIIIFVGCVVGRIYCSTNMAVKNQDLQKYYAREKVLEREIAKLEFESSGLSSIKDLEERAFNMGFVHMTDSVALLDTSIADQFASLGMSEDSEPREVN